MLLKDTIRKIAVQQREELDFEDYIEREALADVDTETNHVVIISGIRRCGKSTLLKQLMKKLDDFYYFNFEDPRILDFEVSDFEKLDEVFEEVFGDSRIYFFDEVQNVEGWESFVRKKQDAGNKFFITGSNASLLSRELGTRLTGRHFNYELFPFSYQEMLSFKSLDPGLASFREYFRKGGFPEFLKFEKVEVLQQLLQDLLSRDIVVRHGIRDFKTLKQMAIYLLTNTGKEFSYNKLKDYFNLGSTNTVTSYVSFFEDSYLLFTIPKYDVSYKKQLINPKKVYSVDVGISSFNSVSFSEDKGRVLENLIFLHLKRRYDEIFYYKNKGECDFVVKDGNKIVKAFQVCYELNERNKDREVSGLKRAMEDLDIHDGIIITMQQEESLEGVEVIPAWKWMSL